MVNLSMHAVRPEPTTSLEILSQEWWALTWSKYRGMFRWKNGGGIQEIQTTIGKKNTTNCNGLVVIVLVKAIIITLLKIGLSTTKLHIILKFFLGATTLTKQLQIYARNQFLSTQLWSMLTTSSWIQGDVIKGLVSKVTTSTSTEVCIF